MQEMFGQLRQWLHTQTIDRQWLTAFLSFLKEVYVIAPDIYTEQWVPYLTQRHDLWQQCLFDVYPTSSDGF